ncbi:MAG: DUF58 domain-containing protein [Phycisphaerae bacterium]|nr:DUF58 domain-containing protein [Phycisphaerae bacterium]
MADAKANTLLEPALLERIKGLALVARRVVEGTLHGLHRSPLHGLSIEFAQHRQYCPPDELKHLDWRVLARSDRYVIKQYEQETNMRVVVVCDCSRSMAYGGGKRSAFSGQLSAVSGQLSTVSDQRSGSGPPPGVHRDRETNIASDQVDRESPDRQSKFHYARVLAAALSYLLLRQGDSVGLMLSNYRVVEQVAPRAAPGQLLSLCQVLAAAQPSGVTDIAAVISQLAARLQRRSLVIIISDLLDHPGEVLASLGQLAHRGHEVIAFQVLDPREIEFDLGLAGLGVTVLRDMETGEEFEAEPQLIRDLVRAEVRRFCERLDAGTRAHGVHLLRCRTSEPVEQVLTRYLHSRLKGRRR